MSATLFITRVELQEAAHTAFMRRYMRLGEYIVPYSRTDVHQHVITPGVLQHKITTTGFENVPHFVTVLFMPARQVLGGCYEVGCVCALARNGIRALTNEVQLQLDPVNFENYFLKRISFELAERTICTYEMNFMDGVS